MNTNTNILLITIKTKQSISTNIITLNPKKGEDTKKRRTTPQIKIRINPYNLKRRRKAAASNS
jgi:hypothetical protein